MSKGEAREKGGRVMMMAGGKRCDGTSGNSEQVLTCQTCHLHKESHGGKPWAKVSGKLCQMLGYNGCVNVGGRRFNRLQTCLNP